jgi:DNA-binding transcriptional MerR regulator
VQTIQQVAAATGVSSRTLRHYDAIGLLPAARDPRSGYRCYDGDSLVRLQRILLLRDLGMGLEQIAGVLARRIDDAAALRAHLQDLQQQAGMLQRRISSVTRTISALEQEGEPMAGDMFDGFDHTEHRDEVEQRWGEKAYADSDRWWRGLGQQGQQDFVAQSREIARLWEELRDAGAQADGECAMEVAARHARWVQEAWGGTPLDAQALAGLGEMYVADERFAANYGGVEGAAFVRDALAAYARTLGGQHAG